MKTKEDLVVTEYSIMDMQIGKTYWSPSQGLCLCVHMYNPSRFNMLVNLSDGMQRILSQDEKMQEVEAVVHYNLKRVS